MTSTAPERVAAFVAAWQRRYPDTPWGRSQLPDIDLIASYGGGDGVRADLRLSDLQETLALLPGDSLRSHDRCHCQGPLDACCSPVHGRAG
jgi:hypothetical protein